MEDKQRIQDAYDCKFLSDTYNYSKSKNRLSLNSLGIIKWATLFEVGESDFFSLDVYSRFKGS